MQRRAPLGRGGVDEADDGLAGREDANRHVPLMNPVRGARIYQRIWGRYRPALNRVMSREQEPAAG
jgi:hypothetical protein